MSNYVPFPISWDIFHRDCRILSQSLITQGHQFTQLVAVTRGGLAPAAVVARELEIRNVDTVCVTSYSYQDRLDKLQLTKAPELEDEGAGVLIVEDLVDSGRTIEFLRNLYPKAHFAVIYARPNSVRLVDSYVMMVPQNAWVEFPWDLELKPSTPQIHLSADGQSEK